MRHSIITTLAISTLPAIGTAAENASLGGGQILDAGYLIKLGGGLILVIALFVAMAWIMRNMGIGTVSKDGVERLKVTATLSVGNRERIVLVDVCGDQVLIGVTQERIETLHVVTADSTRFQNALNESLNEATTENEAT